MLDLLYHILTNDTDVNTAVSGRITADTRVQGTDTPSITMEWVATDDLRSNRDSCTHSVYTAEVYIYSKSLPECDSVMGHVVNALDRYRGSATTATGKTYEIVNTVIQNRTMEVLDEADMCEAQVTIEITA